MENVIKRTVGGHEIHVRHLPATAWWRSSRWELLKEYTSHNGNVTVTVGFISDGATIPIFLRGWFSPTGKYFGAAILHDFIIITSNGEDWDSANGEFEAELDALDVAKWRKVPMIMAVKIYKYFK